MSTSTLNRIVFPVAVDLSGLSALSLHKSLASNPRHGTDGQIRHTSIFQYVYRNMREEVLSAFKKLPIQGQDEVLTVAIGPGSFGDLPLEPLLNKGHMIGVDIDLESMQFGAASLPKELQQKIYMLTLDASLYISKFLEGVEALLNKYLRPSISLFQDIYHLVETTINLANSRNLPFYDQSIDFWVCNICIDTFFAVTKNLFLDLISFKYKYKYKQQTNDLFNRTISIGEHRDSIYNFLELGLQRLHGAYVEKHFREIARILKPGGVAVVSIKKALFAGYDFKQQEGTIGICFGEGAKKQHNDERIVYEEGKSYRFVDVQMGGRENRVDMFPSDYRMTTLAGNLPLTILDQYNFWYCSAWSSQKNGGHINLSEAIVVQKP